MKSLYLPKYGAFIRWHTVGQEGPTVVYLPGLSFSAVANFLDVAAHPALRETTGVMIDYLGAGSSDYPADFPHTLEAHAECVAAVIDHLGCGPCVFVGYSMGGSVAIALALEHPEMVSHLVVGEGNLTPGGGAATRHFASFSAEDFAEKELPRILAGRRAAAIEGDPQAAFVAGVWTHVDPMGLHGNSRALVELSDDFEEAFLSLDIPRTFVYGEQTYPGNTGEVTADAPDPEKLAKRGVSISVVPDTGHNLMLGHLGGFIEVLRQVLAG